MKFGYTIKRIRMEKKAAADNWHYWTQTACGKRAGMTQSQWADLEADRHSPTFDTVEKVADALGCKVHDIVR